YASGGLSVAAAGNITTGQFFVADGIGTLNAGRSFATSPGTMPTNNGPPPMVGSLFALEDAQISLWAQGDINIAEVVNPTVLAQTLFGNNKLSSLDFYTYGPDSALNVQSTSGNVVTSGGVLAQFTGTPVADAANQLHVDNVAPP